MKETRVIGVIQARMGSSGVPGKAMIELAGKPLLWHILDRIRRVEGVSDIVVATTTKSENDILEEFANSENIFVQGMRLRMILLGVLPKLLMVCQVI